jgi:hypothetical protein
MDLTTAYRNLQLDPNRPQRVKAFETLCWRHICHHASFDWVQFAQCGLLPLTWITQVDEGHTKSQIQEYDDTLDTIVHDFMRIYIDILWPAASNMRSHLITGADAQLISIPDQRRACSSAIERIEHLRKIRVTDRMYVVESKIGRRLREHFTELVLTRAMPSLDGSTIVRLLLLVLE